MALTEKEKKNSKATADTKEMMDLLADQPKEFWERMISACQEKLGQPKKKLKPSNGKLQPMNELMALRFEKEKLPWGTYRDVEVGKVRPDYLDFLADGDSFIDELKRYVLSDRFKQRRKEEG